MGSSRLHARQAWLGASAIALMVLLYMGLQHSGQQGFQRLGPAPTGQISRRRALEGSQASVDHAPRPFGNGTSLVFLNVRIEEGPYGARPDFWYNASWCDLLSPSVSDLFRSVLPEGAQLDNLICSHFDPVDIVSSPLEAFGYQSWWLTNSTYYDPSKFWHTNNGYLSFLENSFAFVANIINASDLTSNNTFVAGLDQLVVNSTTFNTTLLKILGDVFSTDGQLWCGLGATFGLFSPGLRSYKFRCRSFYERQPSYPDGSGWSTSWDQPCNTIPSSVTEGGGSRCVQPPLASLVGFPAQASTCDSVVKAVQDAVLLAYGEDITLDGVKCMTPVEPPATPSYGYRPVREAITAGPYRWARFVLPPALNGSLLRSITNLSDAGVSPVDGQYTRFPALPTNASQQELIQALGRGLTSDTVTPCGVGIPLLTKYSYPNFRAEYGYFTEVGPWPAALVCEAIYYNYSPLPSFVQDYPPLCSCINSPSPPPSPSPSPQPPRWPASPVAPPQPAWPPVPMRPVVDLSFQLFLPTGFGVLRDDEREARAAARAFNTTLSVVLGRNTSSDGLDPPGRLTLEFSAQAGFDYDTSLRTTVIIRQRLIYSEGLLLSQVLLDEATGPAFVESFLTSLAEPEPLPGPACGGLLYVSGLPAIPQASSGGSAGPLIFFCNHTTNVTALLASAPWRGCYGCSPDQYTLRPTPAFCACNSSSCAAFTPLQMSLTALNGQDGAVQYRGAPGDEEKSTALAAGFRAALEAAQTMVFGRVLTRWARGRPPGGDGPFGSFAAYTAFDTLKASMTQLAYRWEAAAADVLMLTQALASNASVRATLVNNLPKEYSRLCGQMLLFRPNASDPSVALKMVCDASTDEQGVHPQGTTIIVPELCNCTQPSPVAPLLASGTAIYVQLTGYVMNAQDVCKNVSIEMLPSVLKQMLLEATIDNVYCRAEKSNLLLILENIEPAVALDFASNQVTKNATAQEALAALLPGWTGRATCTAEVNVFVSAGSGRTEGGSARFAHAMATLGCGLTATGSDMYTFYVDAPALCYQSCKPYPLGLMLSLSGLQAYKNSLNMSTLAAETAATLQQVLPLPTTLTSPAFDYGAWTIDVLEPSVSNTTLFDWMANTSVLNAAAALLPLPRPCKLVLNVQLTYPPTDGGRTLFSSGMATSPVTIKGACLEAIPEAELPRKYDPQLYPMYTPDGTFWYSGQEYVLFNVPELCKACPGLQP